MVVLIVEVVMMIGTPLQVVVLIVVVDVVMIGTPKLVGVLIVVIVMMGPSKIERPEASGRSASCWVSLSLPGTSPSPQAQVR